MILSWISDKTDNKLKAHPAAHWWEIKQAEDETKNIPRAQTVFSAAIWSAAATAESLGSFDLLFAQGEVNALFLRDPSPSALSFFGTSEGATPNQLQLDEFEKLLPSQGLVAPILEKATVCFTDPDKKVDNAGDDDPGLTKLTREIDAVIGVIDDGIAPAHSAFRLENGETRIACFWQQDAPCMQPESEVPFGRLYYRQELQERWQAAGRDEERFYSDPDLGFGPHDNPGKPFARRFLHGTHVASLACGSGPGFPNDDISRHPERYPIIAVNLPSSLVSDTSGTFMASAVLAGINRIMKQTERIMVERGKKLPLVINLSFGLMGSGKSGSQLMASYMDACIEYWENTHKKPMRIVLPAGNEFQSQLVGYRKVTKNAAAGFTLRVGPDSRGSTLVEIAVRRKNGQPQGKLNKSSLVVDVTPPGWNAPVSRGAQAGETRDMDSAWLLYSFENQNDQQDFQDDGQLSSKPAWAGVYYGFQPDISRSGALVSRQDGKFSGYEVVTIALPPNTSDNPERKLPACGDWHFSVSLGAEAADAELELDIHVLRNDVPNRNRPIPQRSYLVDPHYEAFDQQGYPSTELKPENSCIVREGTLNAMATGARVDVVGASFGHREKLTYYTAAPRAGKGKVSLHAVAEDGSALAGVRAAGHRSGTSQRLGGTSVAAPQFARALAIALPVFASAKDTGKIVAFANARIFANRDPKGDPDKRSGIGGLTKKNRAKGPEALLGA